MNMSEKDYRILGLSPTAPREEVKRAYRELVKRRHPDRMQDRPLDERRKAEETLKEIIGAYNRITKAWIYLERLRNCSEFQNTFSGVRYQSDSFRGFTGRYSPFSPYKWNRRFLAFLTLVLAFILAFMSLPTSKAVLSQWKSMQTDVHGVDGVRPPSVENSPFEDHHGG
jgi:hypothetical protein